jgi:ATP-dependent DNA helicase RecG
MEPVELLGILSRGEDSRRQFKRNVNNAEAMASELVALSNCEGGYIVIGVDDDGAISGLTGEDITRLNQLVSSAASQGMHPAINPITNNVMVSGSLVMVVHVPEGANKPYQDKDGVFWVKNGADKRKATSREEIQRLFQSSHMVYADETPVRGMTISDLDLEYFKIFFRRRYGEELDLGEVPLSQIIQNMNLGRGSELNLTGALLFARNPSLRLPAFIVKAGRFPGTTLATGRYIDSRDIAGKLGDVFQQTRSFILNNIRQVQADQNVNSQGEPEIPSAALTEIVANALVHRDYFVSAPIRVFIFDDRIEIISPGHLPNNLTVENIKAGNSNSRNPVLASFANHILPYRGYGSGILRALAAYPEIDFIDDRDGNKFVATFSRRE